MLFVRNQDLKVGMRLARPIYNKNGVLLYERDSRLTPQGITSIENFGLFGVFILEPAEPVPPMTEEDIEFERFQTMYCFSIREELSRIITTGKAFKTDSIVGNIIRNYGHLDKPINFIQNLRSREDYVYKHALNVAILSSMIAHNMNSRVDEQIETVTAAILHDIGRLMIPKSITDKKEWTQQDYDAANTSAYQGFRVIEDVFASNPNYKRCAYQAHKTKQDYEQSGMIESKIGQAAKILIVADAYDTMTAMQFETEPKSEVTAIRVLRETDRLYDQRVVDALLKSINVLGPGTCIELNTGEKGLVLARNDADILRPMVLGFTDNKIIDLSNIRLYSDVQIRDIMKTMDNRYIMDMDMLNRQGIHID